MAVSVRIEDEAFSDRRYDVLARILGLPDADCARGKMAAVWRQCTQQQTHILSGEMVREILGENGPDALVLSTLGEIVDGGIRICGTRGRIEWLAKLRKNARKGGNARAAKRLPKRQPIGTSAHNPDTSPPAPAPAPAPVTTKEEERGLAPLDLFKTKVDLSVEQAVVDRVNRATREPKVHPDRARVIDAFHQRFKAASGEKPTWGPKEVGQIGGLLKKHPAEVLIRRINFMFDGKAKWPPPPYTLDVFVANIDKWVEVQPQLNVRAMEELK
jgi:hypothetical protein